MDLMQKPKRFSPVVLQRYILVSQYHYNNELIDSVHSTKQLLYIPCPGLLERLFGFNLDAKLAAIADQRVSSFTAYFRITIFAIYSMEW